MGIGLNTGGKQDDAATALASGNRAGGMYLAKVAAHAVALEDPRDVRGAEGEPREGRQIGQKQRRQA